MKIVKCSKCKKYIPKAVKCFHCGNTLGFDEIDMQSIHENVVAEYSKVEFLIENKKFSEAMVLSHVVIEWMPNLPGIFWLRLLAKNKCVSAVDLIQKGFNCEDDADFCNALRFSSGHEHEAYLDIQNLVLAAKKALKIEVLAHEYKCKSKTDVLRIKQNMKGEIDTRKKELFSLWSDLEETEQSMYILEKDCRLFSKEHSDTLDRAAQESASIKNEVYRLEECTATKLHEYQVKIENVLQQSEQAKEAIESMKKQNLWVKQFNELVDKRDEQIRAIGKEISSLRIYEATVQKTLDEIDRIEELHRVAVRAVESYDFLNAANLLGKDSFDNVLRTIGLGVELQVSIPSQDWQSNVASMAPVADDTDTVDCYEDLPNDIY